MVQTGELDWLELHRPVIDGVVVLFGPWVEVVAHDVARDEIVEIWNPTSGREVGDRSLLGDGGVAVAEGTMVGPYAKVGTRGEPVSSVSISIADGAGLICINFDRSPVLDAAELLKALARPSVPQPGPLFEFDWREQISTIVQEWCTQNTARPQGLTVTERREVVGVLQDKGLFEARHAVQHAARAIGVSRATIYADLREIR